jgi:hypothetical protein
MRQIDLPFNHSISFLLNGKQLELCNFKSDLNINRKNMSVIILFELKVLTSWQGAEHGGVNSTFQYSTLYTSSAKKHS